MSLYRIKPLNWWPKYNGYEWYTDSLFGQITIRLNGRGQLEISCDDGFHKFNSDEAAKAAAEEWYRNRLLEALEPVEGAAVMGKPFKSPPVTIEED